MENNNIRYKSMMPSALLLTFNRPGNVAKVLERIKTARPSSLYVACDGPRTGNDDDSSKIKEIHEMVAQIDWCPDVKTLYRKDNLGCGRAVSEAITWFLTDAGEGIILEDDCLPDPTFFPFCAEMLDRYRNTTNVMQIAGYNFLSGKYDPGSDYLFSQFGWQWGWATWKRAWDNFDLKMTSWPAFKQKGYHRTHSFVQRRVRIFDDTYAGKISTWDYQWAYAMTVNSGLSVVPAYSLVENIGFGIGATHGVDAKTGKFYQVPIRPIVFPIKHCQFYYSDPNYNQMLVKKTGPKTLRGKISAFMAMLRTLYFRR